MPAAPYPGRMSPAKKPLDLTKLSNRLAARIRELREKQGLSVPELAAMIPDAAGKPLPDQTLYGWENGRRKVDLDTLPAIAAALKTTLRKLMPEA